MTKLEELSALLINELHEFNKNIEKLESINKQLNDLKVKMDISDYKSMIESHQNQMETHLSHLNAFENRFNDKIKDAKIYPTWAVVIFTLCILVNIILVSYLFLNNAF